MNPASLFTQGGGSSAASTATSSIGPQTFGSFGGLSFGAASPTAGISSSTVLLVLGVALGVAGLMWVLLDHKKG